MRTGWLPSLVLLSALGQVGGYLLRFYGHGMDQIDRVKVPRDAPADSVPRCICRLPITP